MKKCLYLLISLILFLPIVVSADGIENYYINATIEKNGDMIVEEYFNMTGSFNGMKRIIDYRNSNAPSFDSSLPSYGGSSLHNGDGINILEVRAVDIDSNFSFDNVEGDLFSKVASASKGDYGKYTTGYKTDGIDMLIYLASKKGKAFYIKYKITNVAILHNDVGELGFNFIGNELNEDIDNLVIIINIPDNKEDIRVWGHGPLEGYTEIISKEKVMAKINNLSSNTAVDVRVCFDKEVISNSKKTTNVNALDKIVLYETDKAEQANYERMQNDIKYRKYIESAFVTLDAITSRANYEKAKIYINLLSTDEERYLKLLELYKYEPKVDEYEYKIFKSHFFDDARIHNYYVAKECIDHVFSLELKNKMTEELETLKQMIIKNEKRYEIDYSIVAVVLCIVSLSFIGINLYQKNSRKKVTPEFIRDVPTSMTPSEVGLLTDHTLGKNEISAEFLELIRTKKVKFTKKDNGSYDFVIDDVKSLNTYEKDVKKLIFGSKEKFNSKEKRNIYYETYQSYKSQTISSLKKAGYLDDKKSISDMSLIIAIILLLLIGFYPISVLLFIFYHIKHRNFYFLMNFLIFFDIYLIFSSIVHNHFVHYSLALSIPFLLFAFYLKSKFSRVINFVITKEGKEKLNTIYGFRNYMLYFTNAKTKEIPDVMLLEKYLVYATALGLGDRVSKALKMKIEESSIDSNMLNNYALLNSSADLANIVSISNSVGAIGASAASITHSSSSYSGGGHSYSSGSGHGGGFSGGHSGGGSFGGGGGGGRF